MRQNPNSRHLELSGGEIGILILSDFPGCHLWAHSLHEAGHSVFVSDSSFASASWSHLGLKQWNNWYEEIEEDFRQMKQKCEKVFIAGFDLSGSLALRLAQNFGDEIQGIILLEPSLPIAHRIFANQWRAVEIDLYLVDQPTLVIYADQTRNTHPDNSNMIADEISSAFIREVILERSFHLGAPDHDAPLLMEESSAFINEITSGVWLSEIEDDAELINAEFDSIVAGLSLDESSPTTYLDQLDRPDSDDHFDLPNPPLAPIHDRSKRNAIFAMVAGPIYAIVAAVTSFDPLGVEPWPGVIAFFGGLALFLYRLRDDFTDEDGAIL